MFIELRRIVSKKKKDDSGNVIKDPVDSSKNIYYNVVSPETFAVEDIKRLRPWNRNSNASEYPEIKGDITVIILNDKGKAEEIRVNESHSVLLDRLKAAKLEHEYGNKENS